MTEKNTVFCNEHVKLPVVAREGYTFKGWYTAQADVDKPGAEAAVENYKNHTLYAQWTPNTYVIILDNRIVPSENITVTYDMIPDDVIPPAADGRIFGGYYTKPGGNGEQYIDENGKWIMPYTETENKKLYAYWYKDEPRAAI